MACWQRAGVMFIPAHTMSYWLAFSAGISWPNSTCSASTSLIPIDFSTARATSGGASPVTLPLASVKP